MTGPIEATEAERQALVLWGASCAAAAAKGAPFELTTAAYERAHGAVPRGRRGNGSWGFQRSRTRAAFVTDTYGDVVFFSGSFVSARLQLRRAGAKGLWAVLS